MKMVEDALYNCFFIIDVITRDNDSTIRAVIKHPSKGALGKVLKSSKGKLDKGTPVKSLLTDPTHRVKVFYKQIFSIERYGKDRICECTKSYSILLKEDWGFMINNNINKILDKF